MDWNPIAGLNDGNDGVTPEFDFVGDSSDDGAYWADNGTYVFFRFRVAYSGSVSLGSFAGAHLLMIDVDDYSYDANNAAGTPDYGFAWDSKSNKTETHGLEMQIPGTIKSTWDATSMDDIDGVPAEKTFIDINGFVDGVQRTDDGYVRTLDGQTTQNLGTTTLIDFAVAWDYLETYTDLAKGQTWNIALGSIDNATDHNAIAEDVAGNTSPTDSLSSGWTSLGAVPEPATISLIAMTGLLALIIRRFTS